MQFGSKDWNSRERPGRSERYSGQNKLPRTTRSYSPNEARGSGGSRYTPGDTSSSSRGCSNPSWSTAHSQQWDSKNKDYDQRMRSYDYSHRSTYTGSSRSHQSSPSMSRQDVVSRGHDSRSFGGPSSDWNPEAPIGPCQTSSQSRFTEDTFSDPGEDVPGGSPDHHSRPYWNTQPAFTRPLDQYDYKHERSFHTSTFSPKDMHDVENRRAEDGAPAVPVQSPMAVKQPDPFNVLELANKISSLGPLIRDPRLLTRILKITKTDEPLTSPKREEQCSVSTLSSPVVPSELQWSKPSGNPETVDQLSRQSKLSEYSQKYKIVKKSHPPPTVPPALKENTIVNASPVVLDLGDQLGGTPDQKTETPSKNSKVVNGSSKKPEPVLVKAEKEIENSEKKETGSSSASEVPSVPSFASKAQMLVKDSFIKRKQEGRAKMSTPACKTDNKQNQALLKLVVGSKEDGGNNSKPGSSLQKMSGPNPMVKLPGLKNILNSVMKTSISQVLRNKMDSPNTASPKESKKKLPKDEKVLEAKNSSSEVVAKEPENKDSSVETVKDVNKESGSDASKTAPKVNRARKGQSAPAPAVEKSQANQQATVVTRKQAALSTVFKHKKKKIKKRHFRGGTYNLYLSSKKKKKKGKDTSQADDELSMEGTETTGSMLDSEDDISYASEELMTASEKSFQGDEPIPPNQSVSGRTTPEEKLELSEPSGGDVKVKLEPENISESKENETQASSVNEKLDQKLVCDVKVKLESFPECPKGDGKLEAVLENITPKAEEGSTKFKSLRRENLQNIRDAKIKCADFGSENKDVLVVQPDSEADRLSKKELVPDNLDAEAKEPGDGTENVALSPEHSETVGSSAESHTLSDGEINKENTPFLSPKQLHSIASSVKTRQRVKRRHTDNEHDSAESQGVMADSPFKKPKRVQTSGLSPNSIPTVPSHPVTNLAKIANACFPKLDVIYDHKRLKHSACTCQAKPVEAKSDDTSKTKIYCQAVDSVDEKLIGCCNIVAKPQLVRPSVKIPFTALCEVHLWRLRHHHCCPICGVFCSQGLFMQCTAPVKGKSQIHLFHKCCLVANEDLGADQCPHCGGSKNLKSIQLELNTPTAPTFYLSQKPLFSEPRAKMTINRLTEEEKTSPEDLAANRYEIPDTANVLSAAGLPVGPERAKLDKLLANFTVTDLDSSKFTQHQLLQAAKDGNMEKTLQLLALGFDPNVKDDEIKDVPLHGAAQNGHLVIVHLLTQAGGSVDRLDDHLYTPLMLAVENHQVEVAQYLIKCGAQLLAKGEDGMTCLHLAARCGNAAICRMLMDTGRIMPNVQDDGGWTPIVWAAEHSHLDIVRLLVERGADPNMKDNEQNVALHWSAFSGNVDISHLFLELGSDLSAANEHGDTPLHIAARQNKYACVVLFLARGANIEAVNKENETPIMCCSDTESQTYMALLMNKELKKFAHNRIQKAERVIHSDISKGKELNCIQCVNGVDEEKVPTDYMYVIENCETSTINIDRTITSLQSCRCEDDCTSPNCTCATLSFKCWFDNDGRLLPEFNLSDPPMIFECNRACLCWRNCNNRALQHGILCRLQLFRTHNKGWGVRTLKDIPKGTFICEYIGEIITDGEADQREDDSYLFDLDNRQDGETYCLDARYYGNVSRFVNHQCEPNLVPVKVFVDHQDLSFPRIAFFSSRDIYAHEELGFDYGEKFWVIKYKSFTCDCASPNCKYSEETIQQTLENYYRRLKEEQHAEENIEGQQQEATATPAPQTI